MLLAGVDGCKGGWLAAVAEEPIADVKFALWRRFADLIAHVSASQSVVVVDMPIGLSSHSFRDCDRGARALLGSPRNNSVFSAPCRATLAATSYLDACRLNTDARGKAISQQCFGILHKIRELDACITCELQTWIREAHPEVTFAALAPTGRGLGFAKKTVQGEAERLALLEPLVGPVDISAERLRLGRGDVSRDDVLDAMACLTTAQRIATGKAVSLPAGEPEYDERGLRMEIVY